MAFAVANKALLPIPLPSFHPPAARNSETSEGSAIVNYKRTRLDFSRV